MVHHSLLNKLLAGELPWAIWILHGILAVRVELGKSFNVPFWVGEDIGGNLPLPWCYGSVAIANEVSHIQLWVLIEKCSVSIEINFKLLHLVLCLVLLLLLFHLIAKILPFNLVNYLSLSLFVFLSFLISC